MNVFTNATSCFSFSGPAYELNFLSQHSGLSTYMQVKWSATCSDFNIRAELPVPLGSDP